MMFGHKRQHHSLVKPLLTVSGMAFLGACAIPGQIQVSSLAPVSPLHIQPQQVILKPQKPDDIQVLERLYQGSRLDQLSVGTDTWYLLQVSPQSYEAENLAELQAYLPEPASGLKTTAMRQTWQTAAHILKYRSELVQQLDINALASQPLAPISVNDGSFHLNSAFEGWWLRTTQVQEAWNYSIGTGVKAAYLDVGFKRHHPEIESRMIIHGENNQSTGLKPSQRSDIEEPVGEHGIATLLVGFAERDNGFPSVGVAPNAEVMPYVASNMWEAARAILSALDHKADVVGLNMAWEMYPYGDQLTAFGDYFVLKQVIDHAITGYHLPIVVAAHNYGEPVRGGPREWFPANLLDQPSQYKKDTVVELLVAGGVQIDGKQALSAWFNPNLLPGSNGRGSNYGDGFIWGPSTLLDTAPPDYTELKSHQVNGTSAACPFVTGVVALLKSRAPSLRPQQIRNILQTTGVPIAGHTLMKKQVPMANALKAIEAVLSQENKVSLQDSVAQDIATGQLFRQSTGQWELHTNTQRLKLMSSHPALPRQASQTSPFLNQQVQILGWPHGSGQIEVLKISAVTSGE